MVSIEYKHCKLSFSNVLLRLTVTALLLGQDSMRFQCTVDRILVFICSSSNLPATKHHYEF